MWWHTKETPNSSYRMARKDERLSLGFFLAADGLSLKHIGYETDGRSRV